SESLGQSRQDVDLARGLPFRQKLVAIERRFFRREAVAGDIFGDDARNNEVQEIIFTAGLGTASGHFESAEGMASDNRAGAGAIDVNIAGDDLGLSSFDAGRTA